MTYYILHITYYILPIDCLSIALDAHMLSHNGHGPGTRARCPRSVPGILGSSGPGPISIIAEHMGIKGNR